MYSIQEKIACYDKHQNIKNAALELGLKWQTLYYQLKKAGHKIIGNKAKYGSDKDKLASRAEQEFLNLIPYAKDMNQEKFQAHYDFEVKGLKVDVKASTLKKISQNQQRYVFSIKRQEMLADFVVCFCYEDGELDDCLLLPKEAIKYTKTISFTKGGKWAEYQITPQEIKAFFDEWDIS